MRIGLVSDLHFEFHRDGGGSVVAEISKDCDVLVAAGDIAVGEGIVDALDRLCGAFEQVVYLAGNHEYYGATREAVLDAIARAETKNANLQALVPGAPEVTIGGQRFLGGTLWFPKHKTAPKHAINDFSLISDFESWVYDENRETVRFLQSEVRATDIVVTHHLPSARSTPAVFKDSELNPFFVCNMEHVIEKRRPKLWLHGHTHVSCDYVIGDTRVVCNPFGYPRGFNDAFDATKIIDTPVARAKGISTKRRSRG